jgi:hypothetical protein
MNPHLAAEIVVVSIPVCVIGVVLLNSYIKRRDSLLVLSRHAFDRPTSAEICSALSEMNACCSRFTFGIERSANILFRGQQISLVLGPVGRLTGGFAGKVHLGPNWNFSTCLYALADAKQVEWMQENPDAFSLAYRASQYSVFWVRVRVLKANKALHATAVAPSG